MIATALAMLLILGIQAPPLVRYRKWWDLAVFLAFWSGATAYALLVTAQARIPTPPEVIKAALDFGRRLLTGG
jgi:hypothetical protein